jgi:uncharacterized membrane protein HdeD (DUF308 family)
MSSQAEPGPVPLLPAGMERIRKHWVVALLLGIVLVVLGMFSIACTTTTAWVTFVTVYFLGVVLLVASGVQLAEGILGRGVGNFFLHLLVAVLYFIAGLLVIEHPGRSVAGLTLLIAAVLIVEGILRIVVSLAERSHGWVWVLLNGVISLVLGVMIWRQWPESSLWVIGLFVGIDLLFNGWSLIMLALALRGLPRTTP